MRRSTIAAVLMMLVAVCGLEARDPNLSDWAQLTKLRPGQRVEVIDMSLKSSRGEVVAVSPEEMQLTAGGVVKRVARADVFRVSLRENSKRTRNVLIGLAAGAAAGLVTGALVDRSFTEDDENVGKMLFVPIGIGAGAAIGAGLPGFETIYRAPKRISPAPGKP